MKNLGIILLLAIAPMAFAQSLFEKYEDMDNVTSVVVNQKMFGMLAEMKIKTNDPEADAFLDQVKTLNNLTVYSTDDIKVSKSIISDMQNVKYGKDFNQEKLEVNSQERAFINLTSKVKYVKVRTSSGGIVKLSGTADNQEVDVDLYGTYHGFNMKVTGNSSVKAGTGAKAEILAGETLNAKVSFGGSIFYKGNPEVIQDKKVIGGIIQKRNQTYFLYLCSIKNKK